MKPTISELEEILSRSDDQTGPIEIAPDGSVWVGGMTLADLKAFGRLVDHANGSVDADGHLTIMKFTTNWRVGFETPDDRDDISGFSVGATFLEAAEAALEAK